MDKLESEVIFAEEEEEEETGVEEEKSFQQMEELLHLIEEKQFVHETEPMDELLLESRSTQAWLDIIIQIFKVLVLSKIVFKNTISEIEVRENLFENFTTNLSS